MTTRFSSVLLIKSKKITEYLRKIIKFCKRNTVSLSFMRSLNYAVSHLSQETHTISISYLANVFLFTASDPTTSVLLSQFNRSRGLNGEYGLNIGIPDPHVLETTDNLCNAMKETGRILIEERLRFFFAFDDYYLNQIKTMGTLKKKVLQISIFPYSEVDFFIPDSFATNISLRIEIHLNEHSSFRLRTKNPNVKLYLDFVHETSTLFLENFYPVENGELTIEKFSESLEFRNPRIFNMRVLGILFPPQIDPEDFFTFLYSKASIDMTQITLEKISETFLNNDASSSSPEELPVSKKRSYSDIEKDLTIERFMCYYCTVNPVDTIFYPCGHFIACKSCFFSLPTPIDCDHCHKRVKEYVNILNNTRQRVK